MVKMNNSDKKKSFCFSRTQGVITDTEEYFWFLGNLTPDVRKVRNTSQNASKAQCKLMNVYRSGHNG